MNKEKLLEMIVKASVTQADFELWKKVIQAMPDEFVSDLITFLEMKPNEIKYLTENLKRKFAAIEAQDEKQWDKILEDEGRFIQSLAPEVKFNITYGI